MATLDDDVRSMIAGNLQDLRGDILSDVRALTIEAIVDKAIMGTAKAIEDMFELSAIGACEANGEPHYCSGIAEEYFRHVNN